MKQIKNVWTLCLLLSVTALTAAHSQSAAEAQLDTCKREYIALSWSFDALEQRFIDSVHVAKVMREKTAKENAKQLSKAKRKSLVRGFLWGVPVGIIGGIMAFIR